MFCPVFVSNVPRHVQRRLRSVDCGDEHWYSLLLFQMSQSRLRCDPCLGSLSCWETPLQCNLELKSLTRLCRVKSSFCLGHMELNLCIQLLLNAGFYELLHEPVTWLSPVKSSLIWFWKVIFWFGFCHWWCDQIRCNWCFGWIWFGHENLLQCAFQCHSGNVRLSFPSIWITMCPWGASLSTLKHY